MIPLVFLLAAIGLQGGVYMWAATNTNEAARQGARAQSLGQDGCAAVAATLGGSLDLESCSATGGPNPFSPTRLDVRVRVPVLELVEDYVPAAAVTRTVYLP